MAKNQFDIRISLLTYFAFWDRFIYYGTFTLIILYLTKSQHLPEYTAYSIWGIFAALGFTTPVLGGIIGDKWLSKEQSILYGSCGIFVGSALLYFYNGPVFLIGISSLLCGMGLVKTNLATYLGGISAKKDGSMFNFYFMGMVLGAMLGPAVFGVFVEHQLWHLGFAVTAVGILSTILIGLLVFKFKFLTSHFRHLKFLSMIVIFAAFVMLIFLLFKFASSGQLFISCFLGLTVVYLVYLCLNSSRSERFSIFYLLLLSLFCLAHLLASLQIDGSFTSLIQNHLNHTIFGWKVPTLEFSSIEPMSAAIVSPILGVVWLKLQRNEINIKPHMKVLFGLACSSIAYLLILYVTSSNAVAQGAQSIWFLLGANSLIGVGDALIIPTMMAAVSMLAPKALKGTMMGVWFMADAIAGILASVLVEPHSLTTKLMTTANFHQSFTLIFVVIISTAMLLALSSPWLNKLI